MKLKTYQDLKDNYNKFLNFDKKKSKAPLCHSSVNISNFYERDEICVIEKWIVPEVHILLGIVNHLFWYGLVPLVGESKCVLWPQKLNLVVKEYHGRALKDVPPASY